MLGAAAALVLVLTRPSMPANVAQPLVAAARAGLDDGGAVFTSSDVEQVEAWLENHVGYPVVVPEITDALLKGAESPRSGGPRVRRSSTSCMADLSATSPSPRIRLWAGPFAGTG